MGLPAPGMYPAILEACAAGGWTVRAYSGTGVTATGSRRAYCGLIAIRDGIRLSIEWCRPAPAPDGTRWRRRASEISVRHPGHATSDFWLPYPLRWGQTTTADQARRRRVHSTWGVIRLLRRDNDVLRQAVLAAVALPGCPVPGDTPQPPGCTLR